MAVMIFAKSLGLILALLRSKYYPSRVWVSTSTSFDSTGTCMLAFHGKKCSLLQLYLRWITDDCCIAGKALNSWGSLKGSRFRA